MELHNFPAKTNIEKKKKRYEIMEQTNRTILFEEVNPDKKNLLTMIGEIEGRKSLADEEISELNRELEITSFQDFVEKFTPTVHMVLDTDNKKIKFSKGYLGENEEKIYLHSENSLFQKFLYLMEAQNRKKYVLTKFCDMLENMIPIKNIGCFHTIRLQVMKAAQTNDEKAHITIKKMNHGIFLLRTFLEDTNYLLRDKNTERAVSKAISSDDAKMQVHVIKNADQYRKVLFMGEQNAERYEQYVNQSIAILKEEKSVVHTQLLHDCFLLPIWFEQEKYECIQAKYEMYCQLYIEILQKFWVVAKPMIETMLGIEKFFEQYENTDGMIPRMMIVNFAISDLLTKKNVDKLELYLSTVNCKNYNRDTIWYGILPNLSNKNNKNDNIYRERFFTKRGNYFYKRTHFEELSLLLELLGRYRIQSFLSLANEEEHTFSAFAKKGIDGINRELHVLEQLENKDYLIPCYPNFVVIPREQACMMIGKEFIFDELTGKLQIKGDKNVWFDMVGIEASYIAAGLVAACQCPKYLEKYFGKRVNSDLPGVAYRFSHMENNLVTASNLLSDTAEFADEVMEDALDKSRGVLFGPYQGKMLILTDRVFSYSKSNPLLISMIQKASYIERMIQYETQDYKRNLIVDFFRKRPGSVISKWYNKEDGAVNHILHTEEELQYRILDKDAQSVFEMHLNDIAFVHVVK